MAAFPTDPRPSYPIEESPVEPDVLISRHRDGSEQRRLKGAGTRREFRLTFGSSCPMTDAGRLALVNHFAGQQGTLTSFSWTHPERAEVITVRYGAKPTFRHVGYNAYEAEVVFQEVAA